MPSGCGCGQPVNKEERKDCGAWAARAVSSCASLRALLFRPQFERCVHQAPPRVSDTGMTVSSGRDQQACTWLESEHEKRVAQFGPLHWSIHV